MRMHVSKLFRKPIAVLAAVLLLAGSLNLTILLASAEDEAYKVSLTNIMDRTADDDLEGDNYLDYLVSQENVKPSTNSPNFNGNQAFVASATGVGTLVFKFDAGEGNVLKDATVSWCGRAISNNSNYVNVYLSVSPDDGWFLLDSIRGDGANGTVNNNYNSPSSTDIGIMLGNGVQTFYIKAELNRAGMESWTSFSNLTVEATKAAAGGEPSTRPTTLQVDGIEGDSLTLKKMDSLSFSAAVWPLMAEDRSFSVAVEDPSVVSLTGDNGSYTLNALKDGSTNLTITVNGNTELNRTIRITVSGTKVLHQDYPFLGVPAKTGNTSGGAAQITLLGSYGLTGFKANDYIVHEDIDFTALFGTDGGTAVALKLGWPSAKGTTASWDIYADEISDNGYLTTVTADPWGDSDSDTYGQFAVGSFNRPLTGVHDIYIVSRGEGCNLFNAVYHNFVSNGYTGGFDQSFGAIYNPDYSWLGDVVAYRGLIYDVAGPLRSNNGATDRPAEVVWRLDAADGKVLDTLKLSASARNIKGTGQNLADIQFSVSTDDRQTWHTVYTFDKEANANGMDNGQNPETINIEVTADDYVKGQETVYVKYTLIGYAAGVSWHDTARVKAEATDVTPGGGDVAVTDIDVSATPAITWEEGVGSLRLRAGDEATLTVTVLPVNATDKTVAVTSSDSSVLYVQDNGDGTYTLFADAEGNAVLTVTSGDVTKTVNVQIRPPIVSVELEIDPSLNENVEIVDDGVGFETDDGGSEPCAWTGEFGLGYTTPGDYVKFSGVDFSVFGEEGPQYLQLIASNYSGETTNKVWHVYIDAIEEDNKIATFTVMPLNGWDYKQTVTAVCTQTVTGVHDVYLVCEVGGSAWTLVFTNNDELTAVSYDLPFTTTFQTSETAWLNYVISMNGLNFDGALTAASAGTNYGESDESKLVVNGSMTLKFTAPKGSSLKNVTLQYDGRSILSPQNDANCLLPGRVEFYISTDGEEYTLFETMEDYQGGARSISLAEYTDEMDTFYIRIDVTRTSGMASWTQLTSLSVTTEMGDIQLDIPVVTPEPEGLTIPFETSFDTDEWREGVYARTEGLDVQQTVDANGFDVSCLYPTTTQNYEGIIFKFIPETNQPLDNLVLQLRGRAVGASLLSAAVSTDLENWKTAISLSEPTITDEDYDSLKLYVETFEEAADVLYIRLIFNSTGSSEGFINYSEISYLSVSCNEMDASVSNVPFNTTFSTSRSQLNSWLRRVVDMHGLFIYTGASEVTMNPAANQSGSITLRFNSGEEAFETLYAVLNGKATEGSSILISASTNGKDFSEMAYINEEVNENAVSSTYDHLVDLSSLAFGNDSVWLKLDLTATANAGNCFVNYLSVSMDDDTDAPAPDNRPDDSDDIPNTGVAAGTGALLTAAAAGIAVATARKKRR